MTIQTAVLIFLFAVLCVLVFTLFKSRRLFEANDRIAEQAKRSIELQERSVLAIERVAAALEGKCGKDQNR